MIDPQREREGNALVAKGDRLGFTLIELLIVLGLLGALATLLITGLTVNRQEALDDSIVQKELSDIQRAFQQLDADCVLQEGDYRLISRYGLAVLMKYHDYLIPADGNWSFASSWNADQGKGWRGPYIMAESTRRVNLGDEVSTAGQNPSDGGTAVPVVCTPYAADVNDGHFYRVVPQLDDDDSIAQLWVLYPGGGGELSLIPSPNASDSAEREAFEKYPYKRRLLLRESE